MADPLLDPALLASAGQPAGQQVQAGPSLANPLADIPDAGAGTIDALREFQAQDEAAQQARSQAAVFAPSQERPMGLLAPQMITTGTTTSTSRSRTIGGDKVMKEMEAAQEDMRKAEMRRAEAIKAAADKRADFLVAGAQAEEQSAARIADINQRKDAEVQRHLAAYDRINSELERRAEEGFTDFWADKTTGQKMGAWIGMAFGGLLAGRTGGQNQMMGVIERAIDQDLEKQKAERQDLRRVMDGKANLIQMARAAFDDEVTAEIAAKTMALGQLQKMSDAAAMRLEGTVAQPEAEAKAAEVRMRFAQEQARLLDRVQTNVSKTEKPVMMGAQANPVPGWNVDQRVFNQMGQVEQAKARNSAGAYESAVSNLREMKAIREDVGAEAFNTQESEEFANRSGAVLSALGTMLEMGTMQESDIKRVEKMIGGNLSPEFINDTIRLASFGNYDAVRNRLEGAETAIQTILLPKLAKMGVTPGESAAALNANDLVAGGAPR